MGGGYGAQLRFFPASLRKVTALEFASARDSVQSRS